MAETLRRLVCNETCRILHEKLENWCKDYHINSCDQNVNQCCDIIEMSAMIQGQIFTILNQTMQEGGHYAGVDTIKSRLLPLLGTCFSSPPLGRLFERSPSPCQVSLEKERQLRDLANSQNDEIQHLEKELNSTRLQLNLLQQDLAEAKLALEDTKTKSATTLLAAEDEIIQLKTDLKASQAKEDCAFRSLERLGDYERQVKILKEEIAVLGAQNSVLQSRLARSRSPSPALSRSPSPLPMAACSPGRARLTNASRHARLVERFSDIYAQERLDAQSLLRSYIDDLEMVQRIIYVAVVESFHAAKIAFRQFKMRVRKTLTLNYSGTESLEDMVMDYIIRQEDMYDVQASVSEVIRAMNINPKISFPPEVDFIIISSLIRELCRLAFSMQTLDPPLDISFGTDGELYCEFKYRRSYDSECTAPLVAYHVWPALMEEDSVIVKGEAVTKRGAMWCQRNRGRSRGRSRSQGPNCRHSRSRSRSLSPPSHNVGRSLHLACSNEVNGGSLRRPISSQKAYRSPSRSRSPSPIRNGGPRI